MHPVLAEIIGCKDVPRLDVLRRWQQQLRDQVAPLVDAGEAANAAIASFVGMGIPGEKKADKKPAVRA